MRREKRKWSDVFFDTKALLNRPHTFVVQDAFNKEQAWPRLRKRSRVLVVGAGGLGCDVLKGLALSGFTDLHVIDSDKIELTNLNRQFLFTENDIGKPKAEVAARAVVERLGVVCGVSVTPHFARIESMDLRFYKQFSIIVAGLDSVTARGWLNETVHSLVEYEDDVDDMAKLGSIIWLIDGGTEGMKGQCRVIMPSVSSCYLCSIGTLPKKVTYPMCTIANMPRLPEHCIEYAMTVEWEKRKPPTPLDVDSSDDITWVYQESLKRAALYRIEGVTYQLTVGVIKGVIPAVASTNAIIAAACVNEALKIATLCGPPLENYLFLNLSKQIYTYSYNHEKEPGCMVCGRPQWKTFRLPRTANLRHLRDYLCSERGLSDPSARWMNVILFAGGHLQNMSNLDKPMQELFGVSEKAEIHITDKTLLAAATLKLQFVDDDHIRTNPNPKTSGLAPHQGEAEDGGKQRT